MTPETAVELGELVKRNRVRVGLTQSSLAPLAGVSQRQISRAEQGRATTDTFLRIVKALNDEGAGLRITMPSTQTSTPTTAAAPSDTDHRPIRRGRDMHLFERNAPVPEPVSPPPSPQVQLLRRMLTQRAEAGHKEALGAVPLGDGWHLVMALGQAQKAGMLLTAGGSTSLSKAILACRAIALVMCFYQNLQKPGSRLIGRLTRRSSSQTGPGVPSPCFVPRSRSPHPLHVRRLRPSRTAFAKP